MSKSFALYTCAEQEAAIKSVSVSGNTLTITDNTGKNHTVTLPGDTKEDYVVSGTLNDAAKKITLTRKQGGTVDVSLTAIYAKIAEAKAAAVAADGKATAADGKATDALNKANQALDKATDALYKASEAKPAVVGKGLSGNGTAASPLTIKTDDSLRFTADGKLSVKPEQCARALNLNTLETVAGSPATMKKIGFTCFTGVVGAGSTAAEGLIGSPAQPQAEVETGSADTLTEVHNISAAKIDVSGWQVATAGEVTQVYILNQQAFQRMHDGGMTDAGELKAGTWGQWQRLDNVPQNPSGVARAVTGVAKTSDGKLRVTNSDGSSSDIALRGVRLVNTDGSIVGGYLLA